jgi:hypothetical protein
MTSISGKNLPFIRILASFLIPLLILLISSGTDNEVRADRIVLAPKGAIRGPAEVSGDLAISGENSRNYVGWLGGGLPGDIGLEIEAERSELGGVRRETLSAQYLVIPEGLTNNIAPTISVGIRDILNRGREGRAFFAAATKTLGLNKKQESVVKDWKLHGGYGSGGLGGLYVGLEGRFALGFTATAEYVARRINASLAVPIGRYLSLKAYSFDGDAFYGGGMHLRL